MKRLWSDARVLLAACAIDAGIVAAAIMTAWH